MSSFERIYDDEDGLTYLTFWDRRAGFDMYDLFILRYDLREERRLSWQWCDEHWQPMAEGDKLKAVWSLDGMAANTLCRGRPTNLIKDLTDLLNEILPPIAAP